MREPTIGNRRFPATVRDAAALLVLLTLQACGCTAYSNRFLVGPRPPTPLNLAEQLRIIPKPVSPFGRALGFLSTPFKRMGILGWRDMGIDVTAVGDVTGSVLSTDHFVTVDLRLIHLIADGQQVNLSPERYLRAEVCERELALPRPSWPCPGDTARISGRLMWDGDGFFEVHPLHAADVEILQKSDKPCPWRPSS